MPLSAAERPTYPSPKWFLRELLHEESQIGDQRLLTICCDFPLEHIFIFALKNQPEKQFYNVLVLLKIQEITLTV